MAVPTPAPAAPTVLQLPRIAIQPSLPLVLADLSRPGSHIAAEDAWVSAYNGTRSAHARIRVSEGDQPGSSCDLDPLDDLVPAADLALDPTHCAVRLAVPSLAIPPTTALLPSPRLNPVRPSSSSSTTNPTSLDEPAPALLASSGPTSLDLVALSPQGDKLLLGGPDGHARVVHLTGHDLAQKGPEVRLRGHVGDVCAAGWAASGEVVVTAASDMTVRVFSATDGSSPRVAAVPPQRPTALIPLLSPLSSSTTATSPPAPAPATPPQPHKGRHVLVSSLSGTLTLFDLSPSPPAPLRTWRLAAPVTACVVLLDAAEPEDHPDDVGRRRYALAAGADGCVRVVGLALEEAAAAAGGEAGTVILRAPASGSGARGHVTVLDALPCPGGWTVALGTRDGTVAVYDVPRSAVLAAAAAAGVAGQDGDEHEHEHELAPRVAWRRTPPEPEPGASSSGAAIHALVLSRRERTCGALEEREGEGGERARSVLVAPGDGLAYRAGLGGDGDARAGKGQQEQEQEQEQEQRRAVVHVEEELVGLDCEPARSIVEDGHGRVWVVGAGAVRVYERRAL
ncbi:hypothetical protein JCM3775_006296 [Rhodotorula graminis]